MRLENINFPLDKGWYIGPWNSDLQISLGYANTGIDQLHKHTRITEIYLVAHDSAQMRIEQEFLTVTAGDMILVEPGEAHTFISSSPDYLHFVIHSPGLAGEEALTEKVLLQQY
jgi:mannose-6-phosphate isomerase-like protein (cupin superfamily)